MAVVRRGIEREIQRLLWSLTRRPGTARDVRAVHVSAGLQQYIRLIVKQTRDAADISLGASPRAGIQLLVATQAAAAIEGRDFATPDDVKATAPLVLSHRLLVRPEAEVECLTAEDVVKRVLDAVPVPKEATPTTAAAADA